MYTATGQQVIFYISNIPFTMLTVQWGGGGNQSLKSAFHLSFRTHYQLEVGFVGVCGCTMYVSVSMGYIIQVYD